MPRHPATSAPSLRRVRRALAAVTLVLGCTLDGTEPPELPANDPEVLQENGDFSLAVRATGWTTERSYALTSVERILEVSLARHDYRGGTGVVQLIDYRGEAIYSQPLDGSLAGARRRVVSHGPYDLRVSTTGFTGTLLVQVVPVRF